MSESWRNFTESELLEISAQLPPLGRGSLSLQCPSCEEKCVRWYHYRSPLRAQSKISYVWCRSCKRFYGQTTFQERWDLPDPLEAVHGARELETADMNAYFAELDRLWDAGELPQIQVGRTRRSRKP